MNECWSGFKEREKIKPGFKCKKNGKRLGWVKSKEDKISFILLFFFFEN